MFPLFAFSVIESLVPNQVRVHLNHSGQVGLRLQAFATHSPSSHHQPRVRFNSAFSPDITRGTVEKHYRNCTRTSFIPRPIVTMASAGKDYIPLGRSDSPGPLASDFSQQQVAKQRNNNYHSTSLRKMVATSVNRTALHPGGVQYVAFLPHCPYLLVANCLYLGLARVTPSSRRSFTRLLTLTTIVFQL